jgi:hypothetical protein
MACRGVAGPSAPREPVEAVAGDVHTDAGGWIEYTIGDAPVIFSAPHGGSLSPAFIPTRSCPACITGGDDGLEDLARKVAAQFYARTGRRAHVIINKLSRAKLDPNREVIEGTGGNAVTVPMWTAYHAFIDTASTRVGRTYQRGLLLDLHGTVHPYSRLEIGYNVTAVDLRLSDAALAASIAVAHSGIARLATDNRGHLSSVDLLRGSSSLGAIFTRNGYAAVPSPDRPAPAVDELYYEGGYTTQVHGSANGGFVDAIQVEAWYAGVRDTPTNLDRYAAAVVSTALEYLRIHYGWTPTASVRAR